MGYSGKSNNFLPEIICRRFPSFLIAFAKISPLLLPELSIAFPEIRAKAIGN